MIFRRKRRLPSFQQRSSWNVTHRRSFVLRMKQLLAGRWLSFIIGVGVLAGAGYASFFTPIFLIQSVDAVSEYKDIKTESLEALMSSTLKDQNTFFINLSAFETTLYETFPEISSVACARNFFRRQVECHAYGYELVAVMKHEDQRYYINENGVIIEYDARKLGLPIFDLILNPVYSNERGVVLNPPEAELPSEGESPESEVPESEVRQPRPSDEPRLLEEPVQLSAAASILKQRSEGTLFESEVREPRLLEQPPSLEEPLPLQPLPDSGQEITFIQPDDIFLLHAQSLIQEQQRDPFTVEIGKRILDSTELKTILDSIAQLEKSYDRKVSKAQYVQVAGELSLTTLAVPSTPVPSDSEDPAPVESEPSETPVPSEEATPSPVPETQEPPDHELEILLDLRRDVAVQLKKLGKVREVINFAEIQQIDLSIEGEKVFYR